MFSKNGYIRPGEYTFQTYTVDLYLFQPNCIVYNVFTFSVKQ